MPLPSPWRRAVLLQLSRRDLVVFDRHSHDRRGHLADLNHRPGPTIRRRHRPDAIGHGIVASLIVEQIGRDVWGVRDWRAWHHHERRWSGEDDGRHTNADVDLHVLCGGQGGGDPAWRQPPRALAHVEVYVAYNRSSFRMRCGSSAVWMSPMRAYGGGVHRGSPCGYIRLPRGDSSMRVGPLRKRTMNSLQGRTWASV
jgi:hypothetical protein